MKPWKRAAFYLFGWTAKLAASLWLGTCRPSLFGREVEDGYFNENPSRGVLYATWHRGLVYTLYYYRNRKVVVLASTSDDGELAAQAARRFGWLPVRGSSTRRGSRAFRQMAALLQKGHNGGILVDAPTGPRFVSKPGIILLAKRTGLPILPVMWSADRFWRLNSWDRTIIPKPFARIVGIFADHLIWVPADAGRQECETYRQELDRVLNRLLYQTDHFFGLTGISDPRQIDVPDPVPRPD